MIIIRKAEIRGLVVFLLLGIGLLHYTGAAAAFVNLDYDLDGSVDIDFSELNSAYSAEGGVSQSEIFRCKTVAKNGCLGVEEDLGSVDHVGSAQRVRELEKPGVYEISLYADISFVQKIMNVGSALSIALPYREKITLWKQLVVVQDVVQDRELVAAIEKYAPVMSFSTEENYYPIGLEEIWRRPLSEVRIEDRNGLYRKINTAEDFGGLLLQGGELNQLATIKNSVLSDISENTSNSLFPFGNMNDFPLYWQASEVSENEVVVSYISVFANDIKVASYISPDGSRRSSNHPLDREAVAIRFVRNSTSEDRPASVSSREWFPVSVTYSGHGSDDQVAYANCITLFCARRMTARNDNPGVVDHDFSYAKSNALAWWDKGATTVRWPYYSRTGVLSENASVHRPIVYVANGSHAQYPARGYYVVDPLSIRTLSSFYAYEDAGSVVHNFVAPTDIRQIVLSEAEFRPLTNSGFIVSHDAIYGSWNLGRYRFPPFVKRSDGDWIDRNGGSFESCVRENKGCELSMLLPEDRPLSAPEPTITGINPKEIRPWTVSDVTLRGKGFPTSGLTTWNNSKQCSVVSSTTTEINLRCFVETTRNQSRRIRWYFSHTDESGIRSTFSNNSTSVALDVLPAIDVGEISSNTYRYSPGSDTIVTEFVMELPTNQRYSFFNAYFEEYSDYGSTYEGSQACEVSVSRTDRVEGKCIMRLFSRSMREDLDIAVVVKTTMPNEREMDIGSYYVIPYEVQ